MHRKNPSQGYPYSNDNNARNKVSVNVEHAFYQRGGEERRRVARRFEVRLNYLASWRDPKVSRSARCTECAHLY